MRKTIRTKVTWPYEDNMLNPLETFLYQRIGLDYVTLVMTQAQYDLFYDDVDAETLVANRFRLIDYKTDDKKPVWLFDGRLKVNINIKG
jgi:hypothetical protein